MTGGADPPGRRGPFLAPGGRSDEGGRGGRGTAGGGRGGGGALFPPGPPPPGPPGPGGPPGGGPPPGPPPRVPPADTCRSGSGSRDAGTPGCCPVPPAGGERGWRRISAADDV